MSAALQVSTARIGTRDPDVLDITRLTGRGDALAFAPSWEILRPAIAAMKIGGKQADAAWSTYVPAYIAEMRESYRRNRAAWDALLARSRVVLCCFCTDAQRCHRTVLGKHVLTALGAFYLGEIETVKAQRALFEGGGRG